MESLTESLSNLIGALRSLLESFIRADENLEPFPGKLQSFLEPSMVNAISEACNGVDGLVPVPRSLWDIDKDIPTDSEMLLKSLAKQRSKTDGKDEAEQDNQLTQQIAMGIATLAASLAYSASSASTYLFHKVKHEDQKYRERNIALQEKELELKQTGQNMDACKPGVEQPHKGVIRWHPGTGDIIHPEPTRGRREDGDHGVPGAHWGGGAGIGGGQAAAGHHREAAKPKPYDENPTAGAAKSHTGTKELRHLRGAEGFSQHHPPAELSAASLGKQSIKLKPRKLAEAEVNMRVMQIVMEQQSKNLTLKRELEAAEIARNTARRQRDPIQSKYKRNCIVM